ncbi:MAG: tandem-95 repeat protein [Cyclobacteriaceae bacterium]|nr:tandem-95 repeat protein [Cyclobacteriaceae bacterium]
MRFLRLTLLSISFAISAFSAFGQNIKPIISGQNPLSVNEDNPISIDVGDLVIDDPDVGDTFTVSIKDGTNYTHSGTTVTPDLDFNGSLHVNITVFDGTDESDLFDLVITVNPVNDAPVITGQTPNPINATEDTNFSIALANLIIVDPDNSVFTLEILAGTNYTFSGTTVTPASDYSGSLTVNVRVSDGAVNSNTFGVAAQVAAVNDPPVITGQTPNPINATEDTNFAIAVTNLTVSDPDNSVFTLEILAGTNYTFSGTTVTPASDYSGPLTVNVRVSDGAVNSNIFGVAVQVAAVNDMPTITGQTPNPINATEDTNFAIAVTNLIISDPDNSVFTLEILAGTNYTFSGTTVTPAANYSGSLTVNVRVSDGVANSNTFGVAVQVAAVNDSPVITGQTPNPINAIEDTNFTITTSNLVISDPDNSVFTLTILAGANYTFSGTTITPAANYSGPLTVNVSVSDGTANSNTFGVAVQVAAVNDSPTITGQTPNPINATEDTNFTITTSNLVISDPDNSVFTLTILAGANYTFSGTTITPASNYSGPLTVNVKVSDGTTDSPTFGVAVQVAAVNDAPSITGQTPNPIIATEDTPFVIGVSNLIIADPDNSVFTLTVLAGTNYTFSGSTITPSLNFNGSLTVNVRVSDGTANSATFGLAVQVAAVNDAPVITAQTPNPINATEDTPFTLSVSNLSITDPDNSSFTLTILPGTNYTFSGTTITPNLNYFGALTVNVQVSDGQTNSNTFGVNVQVAAVNDAPVITGQDPLSTGDGQPITLKFNDLNVFDPDNNYPAGFEIFILSGPNYSVSGMVITPSVGYSGNLPVRIFVSDGNANSAIFNLIIQVNYTNKAPTITGQVALSVNEDTPLVIKLTDLVVNDPDNVFPDDFALTILAGTNYTFSGTIITPSLNFNGVLSVNVRVSDGSLSSPTFPLQVTVNPVNDAPTITAQTPNPIVATEDTPFTIQLSNLVITDPDNTVFTLTVLAGTNYTFVGNTITPALNYNGPLSVNVRVNDGAADSPTFGVNVSVTAVNDPPVITGQTPNPIVGTQNVAFTLQVSNLIITDPDNSTFTLTVLAGTNYTFSGNTVTPALNFNGVLTVNVRVSDGAANSATFGVVVNLGAVNVPPQITGQTPNPLPATEDQPVTISVSNLIINDPDNTTHTLTVLAGTNYTVSGNTITPTSNYFGPLTVNVRVSDGVANSATYGLLVQVAPVNDAPTITGQVALSVNEDTPLVLKLADLTVTDPDNTYPTGFTLEVQAGTNYTFAGSTITPALNFNGVLSVNVRVRDLQDFSPVFSLQVTVNPVNDAPVSKGLPASTISEDTSGEIVVNLLNGFSDVENTPNQLTYLIVANDNSSFFQTIGINQALGELRYSIKPNVFGVAKITIRATDTGGLFVQDVLTITINPINDPPSFDPIANQTVLKNSSAQTITLTNVSKGPFEGAQNLNLFATSGNTSVVPDPVITYDGVSSQAQLVFTPQPNKAGLVTITVFAIDDGSNTLPNRNSFSTTFQIDVVDINNPPTLDALANLTIPEDAPLQTVNLTGISAGSGETQALTVTVSTNRPTWFDQLEVVYTSPAAVGSLRITPKANINGTAQITVTVTDNGPNAPAPNVNNVSRSFNLIIQAVNDLPVFVSTPVTNATVGTLYEYFIEATDVDNEIITLTVVQKPAWASFTVQSSVAGNAKAKLSGIPPSGGNSVVRIQAKDPTGAPVLQEYTLVVNTRPVVTSFALSTNEDVPLPFLQQHFSNAFTDADGNTISQVEIKVLPNHGQLKIGGTPVTAGQRIAFAAIPTLVYEPEANYFGKDTVYWNASDGILFATTDAFISLVINPVNDAPIITKLELTALRYEIGDGPQLLTPEFEVVDVDGDSISSAEIGFRIKNYQVGLDELIFVSSGKITGSFNSQTGTISLSGKAPAADYSTAIRSIQYNYTKETLPSDTVKIVYFTLSDGQLLSETRDRFIHLRYSFEDLVIVNAFTPNGDATNNTWVPIDPEEAINYPDAQIKVYNKTGKQVFEATGFEKEWDGTYNGELLPAGSYFYTIDLKLNFLTKVYKGVVTLLR